MITPIVNSPGLYFDSIGILKYYNDYWNIITYSDLSYIKPHIENVKSSLNVVRSTCQKYPSYQMSLECSNILSPLQNLFNTVNDNYMSLHHLTSPDFNHREKRSAWFGIGGPILKQLFGSLDEDDAKTFSDAINAVQDDQRHLASLMKDNIHVITSTISTFNSTVSKLNQNENTLNHNIQALNKVLESISENTNKLEVNSHLVMSFSALESSLMLLNYKLKDLIDSILFGKQNIIHPSILSATKLFEVLNNNSNNLIRKVDFPVPLILDNMHTLLDISEISSFVNKEKLIFVIKIPLVYPAEYNLYHVYALPTPHEMSNPISFAMINPTTKYLAITEDKLVYSNINSVSECKVLQSKYYLCKLGNVYSVMTNPICEVTILTQYVNKMPESCSYKIVLGNIDIWQKISNNRWIYVQSDITKLTVNCDHQIVKDYEIIGTGILKVPKNCKAYHKLLQFIPTNEHTTTLYLPSPNFDIIHDDCCAKSKFNHSLPLLTHIKLSDINLDSLQYASHKLNQVNEELTKIEEQPHYIKYNYYYNLITSLLSVSLGVFVLYKCIKRHSKRRNNHTNCCVKIFNHCYNNKPAISANIEMSTSEESIDLGQHPRRNIDY